MENLEDQQQFKHFPVKCEEQIRKCTHTQQLNHPLAACFCLFLALFHTWPWGWRWYVSPKQGSLSKLYSVTIQYCENMKLNTHTQKDLEILTDLHIFIPLWLQKGYFWCGVCLSVCLSVCMPLRVCVWDICIDMCFTSTSVAGCTLFTFCFQEFIHFRLVHDESEHCSSKYRGLKI
jgi:hypothetical protein